MAVIVGVHISTLTCAQLRMAYIAHGLLHQGLSPLGRGMIPLNEKQQKTTKNNKKQQKQKPAPQPPECHVVAVRITAEDAADGFKPTAGRIDELHFRPTPEVRFVCARAPCTQRVAAAASTRSLL